MRINEADLCDLRLKLWPPTIAMSELVEARPEMFADSWDAFPSLAESTGEVVALLAFTNGVPSLSPNLSWVAVSHQSGGLACNHPNYVGIVLNLKPGVRDALEDLAASYYEEAGGHFYAGAVGASAVIAYVSRLAQLGLHCEWSYRLLEEGVYPIDATDDQLSLIALDPPAMNVFAGTGCYGRPAIVVLAENSD